jgi:phosphoglycerate kinase
LELIKNKITELESIVWNGPFGAFEMKPFEKTTFEVADFIAKQTQASELTSVGGGGDTVSALKQSGNIEKMTYISTAGGAFLEYMEGKELPGVKALEK